MGMQHFLSATTLALVIGAGSVASAQTSTWSADVGHSEVGFQVTHLMVSKVKGHFKKYEATITLDEKDITKSVVDVNIDVASIDTGVVDRDKHLVGAEFFNAEKNPKITFKSTKVQKAKNGLTVTGDLTMNGITKAVTLAVEGPSKEVKDPWGMIRRGASATATINRKDFNMTWNKALEAGGVVVSEEVKLFLEVELIKKV